MWNGLVTPPIGDREGMDEGGEGTNAKEEKGWRERIFEAYMIVDSGVVVVL